jgi:hypothetical protein
MNCEVFLGPLPIIPMLSFPRMYIYRKFTSLVFAAASVLCGVIQHTDGRIGEDFGGDKRLHQLVEPSLAILDLNLLLLCLHIRSAKYT